MHRARILPAVLLIASPFTAASSQGRNWRDNLEAQLRDSIQLTKTDVDHVRITKPGSMFSIQREGISADLSSDATHLVNHVNSEGGVRQAKGLVAGLVSKRTNRDWSIGDKVYITGLDVGKNDVTVRFISQATFPIERNGNTVQTRYGSDLRYDFVKDSLEHTDVAGVLARIRQVLELVASTATAAGAQPKTVELGQTTTQVEAAFGKPEKIIKLGAKVVYVYKDVKVTFTDGKVSDVQ